MSDSAPRLAHVGIAVARIADALPFYRDVLGLSPGRPEEADGAVIVTLPFGDVAVELLEPRDPEGPVARLGQGVDRRRPLHLPDGPGGMGGA